MNEIRLTIKYLEKGVYEFHIKSFYLIVRTRLYEASQSSVLGKRKIRLQILNNW